jgi:zinc protease
MTRIFSHRPAGAGLIRLAAAILLIGLAAAIPHKAEAARIQRVVSSGGIVAWLVESPAVPLVRMTIAFRGGTSQDPEDKPGLAHFTAWMFDEGAGNMDTAALSHAKKMLGAGHDKNATAESFDVTYAMLSENAEASFDILRQMFTEPRYDEDAMTRARNETIRTIEGLRRNPAEDIGYHLFEMIYPGHPYGKSRRGTPEAVTGFTKADIAEYRRKVFARDNLTIGVVGDIDAATLATQLDKVFGALPAKAELKPFPTQATLPAREKAIADDVRQTNIAFGYALEQRIPNELSPTQRILNHILAGGAFASRLTKEVRVKRGLVYGIGFQVSQSINGQYAYGSFGAEPATAEEAYKVAREVIAKFAEEGPTAEELQDAKTYLEGSYLLNLSDSSTLANELVVLQRFGEGLDAIDTDAAKLQAVTLDDVRKLAKQVLRVEAISRVTVGPLKHAGAGAAQTEAAR